VIEDGRPREQEENQPGARGSDEEIGRGSGRFGERVLKRHASIMLTGIYK
jgi:hypothetical protein